ncbi:MAG: hypothetical protein KF752_19380 [Pirellulaceae bacterium]|nr:hypothetical protein [Pirellulaceae bacterium]
MLGDLDLEEQNPAAACRVTAEVLRTKEELAMSFDSVLSRFADQSGIIQWSNCNGQHIIATGTG